MLSLSMSTPEKIISSVSVVAVTALGASVPAKGEQGVGAVPWGCPITHPYSSEGTHC